VGIDPSVLSRDGLFVLADGYVERRESARLRAFENAPYVIELEPEFTAQVRVLVPGEFPAGGARLAIQGRLRGLDDPAPEQHVTDATGTVSYTYRYERTFLRVDLDGFATASLAATTPITTIRLEPGRSVTAVVRAADGTPVEDCRAQWTSARLSEPLRARTDTAGRFSMGRLAPGDEVTVRFYHPDFPGYQSTGTAPQANPWEFVLPEAAFLEGQVREPDGSPAAGALAFLMTSEDAPGNSTGLVSNLNTAGIPKRGRGRYRLRPLTRARVDEEGFFSLGPVAKSHAPYLFILHERLTNSLSRVRHLDTFQEITLSHGKPLKGRLMSPSGEPLAGALLHVGEVWSNGVEGIVGRTRTAKDGSFELVGLPGNEGGSPEFLQGTDDEAPEVFRSLLFLTAFAPDELLSLNGLPVEESGVPGGFALEDALESRSEIRLIGAKRGAGVALNLRLLDLEGLPVRAWTRAMVFGGEQIVHGVMGRNLRSPRFYSDGTLETRPDEWRTALLLPQGYRWQQTDIDPVEGATQDVVLTATGDRPTHVHLRDEAETPAAGRQVFVEVPFGADIPHGVLYLGTTNADGAIDVSYLPPGSHAFRVVKLDPSTETTAGRFILATDFDFPFERASVHVSAAYSTYTAALTRGLTAAR
jgi:hypothetical protein